MVIFLLDLVVVCLVWLLVCPLVLPEMPVSVFVSLSECRCPRLWSTGEDLCGYDSYVDFRWGSCPLRFDCGNCDCYCHYLQLLSPKFVSFLLFVLVHYWWKIERKEKWDSWKKEKCMKRDSNPRVRTHYGLNVTPWTTRASVLVGTSIWFYKRVGMERCFWECLKYPGVN